MVDFHSISKEHISFSNKGRGAALKYRPTKPTRKQDLTVIFVVVIHVLSNWLNNILFLPTYFQKCLHCFARIFPKDSTWRRDLAMKISAAQRVAKSVKYLWNYSCLKGNIKQHWKRKMLFSLSIVKVKLRTERNSYLWKIWLMLHLYRLAWIFFFFPLKKTVLW